MFRYKSFYTCQKRLTLLFLLFTDSPFSVVVDVYWIPTVKIVAILCNFIKRHFLLKAQLWRLRRPITKLFFFALWVNRCASENFLLWDRLFCVDVAMSFFRLCGILERRVCSGDQTNQSPHIWKDHLATSMFRCPVRCVGACCLILFFCLFWYEDNGV